MPKEEYITESTIRFVDINNASDSSRIDKAQVDMEDLESQIEPTSSQMENESCSEQLVADDSSKFDEVTVVSQKEEDVLPFQSRNANELDTQVSRIDDAMVEDNEKGDTIKRSPSTNELKSSTLEMSKIDDADIQPKDVEVDIIEQEDTLASEKNTFSVDSSRLDSAMPTEREEVEVKNEIISIDIRKEVCETSSRIDNVIVESNNDKEPESSDREIGDLSDSRLDNIKVPSLNGIYNADITITSPSPSNDASVATPEKFVI